jgi:hypothetical protein
LIDLLPLPQPLSSDLSIGILVGAVAALLLLLLSLVGFIGKRAYRQWLRADIISIFLFFIYRKKGKMHKCFHFSNYCYKLAEG